MSELTPGRVVRTALILGRLRLGHDARGLTASLQPALEVLVPLEELQHLHLEPVDDGLFLRLHHVLELHLLLVQPDLVAQELLHLPPKILTLRPQLLLLPRQVGGLLLELVDDELLLSLELPLELDLLRAQPLALRRKRLEPPLQISARLVELLVLPGHLRLQFEFLAHHAVQPLLERVSQELLLLLHPHQHLPLLAVHLLQLLHEVVRQKLLLLLHAAVRAEVLTLELLDLRGVGAGAGLLARSLETHRLQLPAKFRDILARGIHGESGPARASTILRHRQLRQEDHKIPGYSVRRISRQFWWPGSHRQTVSKNVVGY